MAVALSPAPAHWLDPERSLSATAATSSATVGIWQGLARALPVGDLPIRTDLVATALVLLNAAGAVFVAHAMFRGPGRWFAAVTAGPVAALALTRWAAEVGSGEAVGGLVISGLASLGLGAIVRARVRFGHVTPVAAARALASITAIALVSPRAALPLLALTIPMTAATARRRRWDGKPASAVRPAVPPSRWLATTALGVGPMLVAAGVLIAVAGPLHGPDLSTFRVRWPDPALASTLPFASILWPATALLLVMTFVLRWRGGPWLLAWALVPLLLADAAGPWIPASVLVVVVAVAAAGWVWLAGLSRPHHRRQSTLAAAAAALGLGALSWSAGQAGLPGATTSVAALRPAGSLVFAYTRGMLAPGDVVVVHDPWLLESLLDRRAVEGLRPDVALLDASQLSETEIARMSLDWRATGRRLLSDSYTMGGRWSASWAIDSGPLFWFIGPTRGDAHEFTDLRALFPASDAGRTPARMRRWHRLAIERSRFRRAVGDPQAALSALPLDTGQYRGLVTRLQLARSAGANTSAGSELPAAIDAWEAASFGDEALVLAEAGDLLFSFGEQERAAELLIAAANDGYAPAWGALARWQFRSGQSSAATATLSAIASAEALRPEGLAVLRWLLRRERVADAQALVTMLGAPDASAPPAQSAATDELAIRLRLLAAMAVEPPGFSGLPSASATGQR